MVPVVEQVGEEVKVVTVKTVEVFVTVKADWIWVKKRRSSAIGWP